MVRGAGFFWRARPWMHYTGEQQRLLPRLSKGRACYSEVSITMSSGTTYYGIVKTYVVDKIGARPLDLFFSFLLRHATHEDMVIEQATNGLMFEGKDNPRVALGATLGRIRYATGKEVTKAPKYR